MTFADAFLTIEDFAPLVGRDILIDASPEPLLLHLESVRPSPDSGLGERREPFSLVFSTPWTVLLSEAAYPMQLKRGVGVVHIIPTQTGVGPKRFYHAVFN